MGARNSSALRLNLEGRTITLVGRSGLPTATGKYFYEKVRGTAVPDNKWGDDAPTYRKPGGRTDYVKMRSGAEVALRTWNPTRGDFDYTARGKEFYRRRPKSYIVQVPVTIYVRRRDGREQEFYGTYPAADFFERMRALLINVVGGTSAAKATIKKRGAPSLGRERLLQKASGLSLHFRTRRLSTARMAAGSTPGCKWTTATGPRPGRS